MLAVVTDQQSADVDFVCLVFYMSDPGVHIKWILKTFYKKNKMYCFRWIK